MRYWLKGLDKGVRHASPADTDICAGSMLNVQSINFRRSLPTFKEDLIMEMYELYAIHTLK